MKTESRTSEKMSLSNVLNSSINVEVVYCILQGINFVLLNA